MANKPIIMSKVRQILKLYVQHMGKKKIAIRLGMSKNTVKLYIDLYLKLKTPCEELLVLTDFELDKLFHPPKAMPLDERLIVLHELFPHLEKQLRKRGMTMLIQYGQYRLQHPQGFGKTCFYAYYRQWCKKVNPTMHIEHIIGDKMYVDFAGGTLPYVDTDTGEIKPAQVFVAILGWSQYTYVEAVASQKVEDNIGASENALHYFNGAPLAIVPDNFKAAVVKSNRYEPHLNENFKAFADHYGMTILPARVRKPRDKAHVENMVKIVYQKIYTQLPEKGTPTLIELNAQLSDLLIKLNEAALTQRDYSRRDQWLMELSYLQPLPVNRFELFDMKKAKVMKNSHICLGVDRHYYSVPYELIGKTLKLHYSRSKVEIYDDYQLVAVHKRVRSSYNYSTEQSHLSPQHQTQWSPAYFIEKAAAIDKVVEDYIREILAKKKHPEQAYKSCQGILSFAKRAGNERLIKACRQAQNVGYYSYKIIEEILKKNLDCFDEEAQTTSMPLHDNIRGGGYYQ